MDALTINEAAETTGWSPRMLRYIERMGLVEPARSAGGYRLYGPGELQRLRTLRELLDTHGLALGEVGFARRMQRDDALRTTVEGWLEAEPARPAHVPADDWLMWEQDKHERLVAEAARRADTTATTNLTETR
ncbi:MerR family transcriptional regulator [Patulibacter sp. S7RM1-6]